MGGFGDGARCVSRSLFQTKNGLEFTPACPAWFRPLDQIGFEFSAVLLAGYLSRLATWRVLPGRCTRPLLCLPIEVLHSEYLADLCLALPSRPVFQMKFHKAHCPFDRLLLRFQFELRIAADHLLGLGERPIDHGQLTARDPDAGALRSWGKPS